MNRTQLIQWARDAGGVPTPYPDRRPLFLMDAEILEAFAALVTAAERQSRQAAQIENEALKARIARSDVELQRAVIAEREACAKVAEEESGRWAVPVTSADYREIWAECAAAIRARGAA